MLDRFMVLSLCRFFDQFTSVWYSSHFVSIWFYHPLIIDHKGLDYLFDNFCQTASVLFLKWWSNIPPWSRAHLSLYKVSLRKNNKKVDIKLYKMTSGLTTHLSVRVCEMLEPSLPFIRIQTYFSNSERTLTIFTPQSSKKVKLGMQYVLHL